MSSEYSEPPIEPARAAGSHSRYSAKSSSKTAGNGVGTQPDSSGDAEYALAPTRRMSYSAPASSSALQDDLVVLPRSEELESGLARHAVAERLDRPPGDADVADVEELDLGHRPAEELLHDLVGVRALQLVAVERRRPLAHVRVGLEAVVDVLAGRLGLLDVEAHPVDEDVVADEHETLAALGVVEQDAVADEVAVLVDRDQLLGDARRGTCANVFGEIELEHRDEVVAVEEQLRHVVRLVHERDASCSTRAARRASW